GAGRVRAAAVRGRARRRATARRRLEPAAVADALAGRKPRVRLRRLGRRVSGCRAVTQSDWIRNVGAPIRCPDALPVLVEHRVPFTRTDAEHDAWTADDHVRRSGRAMDEIPLPERALLAFDDERPLAGQDEEVLFVGLPVVH